MNSQNTLINSFTDFELTELKMPIICVYENPDDFKGMFVARIFDGFRPLPYILMRTNLEEIRREIPDSLRVMPRVASDDQKIVETWL